MTGTGPSEEGELRPVQHQGLSEQSLDREAFACDQRDLQQLAAAWNSVIEGAADRLSRSAREQVNAAKFNEKLFMLALRPLVANSNGENFAVDGITPEEFKQKAEVKPPSCWLSSSVGGETFEQARTRAFDSLFRSCNGLPTIETDSRLSQAFQGVIVDQICVFEESINHTYSQPIELQRRLVWERIEQIKALQKIEFALALASTGVDYSSDNSFRELGALVARNQEDLQSEYSDRLGQVRECEKKILHANLSLLSALASGSGNHLEIRETDLSASSRQTLSSHSIIEIVESMLADPNVWPHYRAQQIDLELIGSIAKSAAERFISNVPEARHGKSVRLAKDSQEELISYAIELFISDAIDRQPRFARTLRSNHSYGWEFLVEDELSKFSDPKIDAEGRRKLICRYLLGLLACDSTEKLPKPEVVNSLLKPSLEHYRQAVKELTPVIRLCAAASKVTRSALDAVADARSETTDFIEVSVRQVALPELNRFIELCAQVVPESSSSPRDQEFEAILQNARSQAVSNAIVRRESEIAAKTERIDQFRAYRAELSTLLKLRSELAQTTESEKAIDQVINETEERRNAGGLKDAVWRRFKAEKEVHELYAEKREVAELLASQQRAVTTQEEVLRNTRPKNDYSDTSPLGEALTELDAQIEKLEAERHKLEARKIV